MGLITLLSVPSTMVGKNMMASPMANGRSSGNTYSFDRTISYSSLQVLYQHFWMASSISLSILQVVTPEVVVTFEGSLVIYLLSLAVKDGITHIG